MKVILLQDVAELGKKYDLKEVPDGYGRNFLIPKKLAKQADKESMAWVNKQKLDKEHKAEEDLKKIQKTASDLDGREIEFLIKTGDEGQLFESVNALKIAKKLKEDGFDVKKDQINLKDPIKEVGEFPIKITLDQGLEIEIRLIITGQPEHEIEE
jgi:large subunit ribosomal protein L9